MTTRSSDTQTQKLAGHTARLAATHPEWTSTSLKATFPLPRPPAPAVPRDKQQQTNTDRRHRVPRGPRSFPRIAATLRIAGRTTRGMPRAPDPGAENESARRGRSRGPMGRSGADYGDRLLTQPFLPAAPRDEPGPIPLFSTATASRRGPTEGLGAAALDRAASGARAPAHNLPTWQLRWRFHNTHTA